jgi:hypothetical protein
VLYIGLNEACLHFADLNLRQITKPVLIAENDYEKYVLVHTRLATVEITQHCQIFGFHLFVLLSFYSLNWESHLDFVHRPKYT